ncbi:MAG: MFS transporter [Methanomicrobiales archaeon]
MIDLLVFIIFAVLSSCAWSIESHIAFRFLLGIGIRADYPVCASYVSEFMPKQIRGRMQIAAFRFQAVGIFAAAGIVLLFLAMRPTEYAWRMMLVAGAVPTIIILLPRRGIQKRAWWHIQRKKWKLTFGVVRYLIPDFTIKNRPLPRW